MTTEQKMLKKMGISLEEFGDVLTNDDVIVADGILTGEDEEDEE
jgi:hypothetical protein